MTSYHRRKQLVVDAFHVGAGLQTDITGEAIALIPVRIAIKFDGIDHIELQMTIGRKIFEDACHLITIRMLLIAKQHFAHSFSFAKNPPGHRTGKEYLVAHAKQIRIAHQHLNA